MLIRELLLPEFDQEMAGARKTLERVPEEKFAWKPHEKSGSLGWLAGHIAEIPGWVSEVLGKESLDIAPGGQHMESPAVPQTRAEVLEKFDQGVAAARAALAAAGDELWPQNWSLLANGQPIFTMSRLAVYRSFVLNHLVHHRAQLGVYLRLNDVPVPALYGPSADESSM
jgi:uncharacterized damage-inducible protein DinB